MSVTYELMKSEIKKLRPGLCAKSAADEGKKFALLILKKLSGLKGSELSKAYTEGSGDHQVDGIYFGESDDLEINIIACKFTKGSGPAFPDKDITDFLQNGIAYLILGEEKVTDFSNVVKEAREDVINLKDEYAQKYIVSLKFVSPTKIVLSQNSRSAVQKYLNDFARQGISGDFEEINDHKLSSLFSSRVVLTTPMKIKLSGKSYYSLTGKEGFACRLPLKEIINIYCGFIDDSKKEFPPYGDFLFTDNVRKNLGLEKKINKSIYETATDSKSAGNFEYYNNGLTIIYEKRDGELAGDSPILYLSGLQVVNGCQTVNTLIRAYGDKKIKNIDDIYIHCRFIKRTGDNKFMQSVITYTNSQNAITDRDLHANDPVQYDVQGILKKLGIFYERKLNEFRDESDDLRVDALYAAQAFLCCKLQEPKEARLSKRKIFADLYTTVFNPSNGSLAYELYISYCVMEFAFSIQANKRAEKRVAKKSGKRPRFTKEDLIITNGTFHISALIYKDIFLNKSASELQAIAKNFQYDKELEKSYKGATSKITNLITNQKVPNEGIAQWFKTTELIT